MELLNISILFILVSILFLLLVSFVIGSIHRFSDIYLRDEFEFIISVIVYLFVLLFVLVLMRIAIVVL